MNLRIFDFIFNCHGINKESLNKKLKSIFHSSDFIEHEENEFNSIFNWELLEENINQEEFPSIKK